jgi:hypothetical protein
MPNKVYNWPALKAEFMASDIDESYNFLKLKFGKSKASFVLSGVMSLRSRGWSAEKKAMRQRVYETQLKQIEKNTAKFSADLLTKVRHGLLKFVIQETEGRPIVNGENLATAWRLVRTEAGLPTSISKQETVDLTELEKAREELEKNYTKNDKKHNTKKGSRLKNISKPKPTAKP